MLLPRMSAGGGGWYSCPETSVTDEQGDESEVVTLAT